jgi:DNA-binding GntR family transcriptional regulator
MNKKDLKKEVYNELRARILNAVILPGVRISDKDIAKELGTSRTPVREALIRLGDHGLVQAVHNRGFTVREFTIKEVKDIYIVREALEVLAIGLTAENLDSQKRQTIQDLLDEYPQLIASGSRNAFNRADEKFHLLIARFSDNALLVKQLNSLHDQLAILRRYAHLLADGPRKRYEEDTYREHLAVFELLVQGEMPRAKQVLAQHIQASMHSVIEVLEKRPRVGSSI